MVWFSAIFRLTLGLMKEPHSDERSLEHMIADGDATAPTLPIEALLSLPEARFGEGPSSEEVLSELGEDKV